MPCSGRLKVAVVAPPFRLFSIGKTFVYTFALGQLWRWFWLPTFRIVNTPKDEPLGV